MLGGIVLNRVSLHCLVLQLPDRSDRPTYFDIVLHCPALYYIVCYGPSCWGGIVLNRVSLHCPALQLPDGSDRPTMCAEEWGGW